MRERFVTIERYNVFLLRFAFICAYSVTNWTTFQFTRDSPPWNSIVTLGEELKNMVSTTFCAVSSDISSHFADIGATAA
jgi:hypothetical protein